MPFGALAAGLTVVLLPLAAWSTLSLLSRPAPGRLAAVLTLTLPATVAIAASEALSALGLYSPVWINATLWACCAGITLAAVLTSSLLNPARLVGYASGSWKASGGLGRAALVGIAVISLATSLTGAVTAPNNLDSLAYHLPRIMQWLQAGRITHVASPFPAQVYLPPGSDLLEAVFYTGLGTDKAMFLVQWLALAGSVTCIVVAGRNLGVKRAPSLIGALFFAAAPLVVGEAATTQNDVLSALWVAAALACVTTPWAEAAASQRQWRLAMMAVPVLGASALVTKPTAAIFVAPLLVWACLAVLRHDRAFATWVAMAALASGVVLNAGWVGRNLSTYSAPFGPTLGLTVPGDHLTGLASNSVKNLGHNLAVPGQQGVNEVIAVALAGASEAVSGAAVDDPRFSYNRPYDVDSQRNEDRAANLLQGLAIAVALVTCLGCGAARRAVWPVAATFVIGYALFSALFQYQFWGGRLLLPWIGLGSVLVAAALSHTRLAGRRWIGWLLLIACLTQSLPWLVAQRWRPLIGSSSVVWTDDFTELTAALNPEQRTQWQQACAYVGSLGPSVRTVGLSGDSSYVLEYVWWSCLGHDGRLIGHVDVGGPTAVYAWPDDPDVVITPWDPGLARDGYSDRSFGAVTIQVRGQ